MKVDPFPPCPSAAIVVGGQWGVDKAPLNQTKTRLMNKLNEDTKEFLEALLWVANDEDSTIYEFHPHFSMAVERFIEEFRDHMAEKHPSIDLDIGERSFGGNIFFTLSSHGCGFWDDANSEWGKLVSNELEELAGHYRFEELEHHLHKENGKIHLSFTPESLDLYLARYFSIGSLQPFRGYTFDCDTGKLEHPCGLLTSWLRHDGQKWVMRECASSGGDEEIQAFLEFVNHGKS